jgi:hypothetical protein
MQHTRDPEEEIMLSYNDQLIHEAHNDQVCRELLSVSKQHQALKAVRKGASTTKYQNQSIQNTGRSLSVLRLGYAVAIALVTFWLTAQVAVAAYNLLSTSGGGGLGALFH